MMPPEYCHSCMGDGVCAHAVRAARVLISSAAHASRRKIKGT
jgi:hypothetical protein